jgi:hypothetical protein
VGPYLEDNRSDVAALVEHGGQLLPLPAGPQVQHVEGVVVGGPVSIIIASYQVDLRTWQKTSCATYVQSQHNVKKQSHNKTFFTGTVQ